jgi:hypothetical protein
MITYRKSRYVSKVEYLDDRLNTRAGWSEVGRSVIPKEDPVASYAKYRSRISLLFGEEQTRLKGERQVRPPERIDLLQSLHSVAQAAKRYRDAASAFHRSRDFKNATANRKRKEDCYALKDRGIVAAFRASRIEAVEVRGAFTHYRGEGYSFHSYMRPRFMILPELLPDAWPLKVKARPTEAGEPRLKDAMHTLELLPSGNDGFIDTRNSLDDEESEGALDVDLDWENPRHDSEEHWLRR